MHTLVRKIDKSKWFQTDIVHGEDISADAITNCIRTKDNTLSVWKLDSDNDLDEAVLAIVAGHQYLETIDVVPLSAEYLCNKGIDCTPSRGLTPVQGLAEKHADLTRLSYQKLGTIAYHIVERIKQDRVQRYTIGRQKQILKEAIIAGKLTANDLPDAVRDKL